MTLQWHHMSICIKSPAIWLFVLQLVQVNDKEQSKLHITGLLWEEIQQRLVDIFTKGQYYGKYFHAMTSSWIQLKCQMAQGIRCTSVTVIPTFHNLLLLRYSSTYNHGNLVNMVNTGVVLDIFKMGSRNQMGWDALEIWLLTDIIFFMCPNQSNLPWKGMFFLINATPKYITLVNSWLLFWRHRVGSVFKLFR